MKTLNIVNYTPESSLRNPGRMISSMLHDLISGRELAWQLAVRDIRVQYRQTILGLLWAFILPLANTITWIFLSRSGVVQISNTALPYPVYVFSGTIIWAIFMDAVNAPLHLTIAAKHMLAKINFPKESIIISGVYQALFNGLIKIVLLLSTLMIMDIHLNWKIIYFPFGIFSLIIAGTAIGLLIAPVGVLYNDVGKSLPLLLQFLMYTTPVVFPMPSKGLAAILFKWNPLTPLVMTTRDWLTGFLPAYTGYFFIVNVITIIVLLLVWVIYRISMPILIERMSA